jgi:hypothetical protein
LELGPSYHPLWDQISLWHQYVVHPELQLSLGLETQTSSLDGYQGFAEGIGRAFADFLPDETTGIEGIAGSVPAAGFALVSVGPNPFRSATALDIRLPQATRVQLTVHDALGRRVRTLFEAMRPAGPWVAVWDGRNDSGTPAAGGVYFLRLHAAGGSLSEKVTLLR